MTTSSNCCPGCDPNPAAEACIGSLSRLGVLKVHWEIWSDCNFHCSFCYRTLGKPIDTASAARLLKAVRCGGVRSVALVGGDPSIRQDIPLLVALAHSLGLQVEVQTNGHFLTPEFREVIEKVELVSLSLDGSDADSHDSFRDMPGNFNRVLAILKRLGEKNVPVCVRTLVSRRNYKSVPGIAHLINGMENIARWSLMEFSPVGDGFTNRQEYLLDTPLFDRAIAEAQARYVGPAQVDVYRSAAKVGTYLLITPDGRVYGTGTPLVNGLYPTVGSILSDHLSLLASRLPFSGENHRRRYEQVVTSFESSR